MIKKLIDKYMQLKKDGYETVTIEEVIKDLRGIRTIRKDNKQSTKQRI